jgi:hypothetical protein
MAIKHLSNTVVAGYPDLLHAPELLQHSRRRHCIKKRAWAGPKAWGSFGIASR